MFDNEFKINVNKNSANEKIISLLIVRHPSLTSPIRLVNDSKSIVFEGEEYVPFPMRIKLNNQVENELPSAKITIPNVAKQITKAIDATGGARNGEIEVILTRRSSLVRDYSIFFKINSVLIDSRVIEFSISIQDNILSESIRWKYDKDHAIGIF